MTEYNEPKQEEEQDNRDAEVSIEVNGNVEGPMNVAGRDINNSETYVLGDQTNINVDTVSGGNIAIGQNIQQEVTSGSDVERLSKAFAQIMGQLEQLKDATPADVAEAQKIVNAIRNEIMSKVEKGKDIEELWLAERLSSIARMGPDILHVVSANLLDPAAGATLIVKKITEKSRDDNDLEAIN